MAQKKERPEPKDPKDSFFNKHTKEIEFEGKKYRVFDNKDHIAAVMSGLKKKAGKKTK